MIGLALSVAGVAGALADEKSPDPAARAAAEEAVITSAQLPPGFTREATTGTGKLPCGGQALRDVGSGAATASAMFQGGRGGDTFVYTEVSVFGSPRAAEELYSAIVEASRSCSTYTYTEEGESQDIPVRVETSAPPGGLGERSVAVETFEGTAPGTTWVRHSLYVQDGPSVASLVGASYSRQDARDIVQRVASAVSGRLPESHTVPTADARSIAEGVPWQISLVAGVALSVGGVGYWVWGERSLRRDAVRPTGSALDD